MKLHKTLLLALGVPCSAQLGVILGLFGALPWWAAAVWGGVVLGVLFGVGALAARLLPGERSELILEVPPIRRPQLANIVIKTVGRLEWYLKEAVPVFVIGTFVLFMLDATGALSRIVAASEPAVSGLLNLPAKAAEAFLIGFLLGIPLLFVLMGVAQAKELEVWARIVLDIAILGYSFSLWRRVYGSVCRRRVRVLRETLAKIKGILPARQAHPEVGKAATEDEGEETRVRLGSKPPDAT